MSAAVLSLGWSCTKTPVTQRLPAPGLEISEVTRSSVAFEWTEVKDALGYVYNVVKDGETVSDVTVEADVLSAVVENLEAGTEYVVMVKATGAGAPATDSEWSRETVSTQAPPTYVEFGDQVLEKYIMAITPAVDADGSGTISFDEAKSLKAIEIGFEYAEDAVAGKVVTDLSGLEHFTSLETLNLKFHSVSDATPVEGLTSLAFLNLGENPIGALDLSRLSNLTDLRLYGTDIETLDFASAPLIQQLYLQRTKIKEIDLSVLKNLQNAFLNQCTDLTKLTAKGLENLTRLDAVECSISEVDLSDCASLMELHLNSNKIAAITLEGFPKLMRLNLYSNRIQSVDLTNLPFLMWLYVFDNQLSALDLSGNVAVRTVSVSKNPIKTLDFGANSQIEEVEAEGMPSLEQINLKNDGYSEWAYYAIASGNPALKKVIVDAGLEFEAVSMIFKDIPSVTVTTE